jgi:hypothetical protein
MEISKEIGAATGLRPRRPASLYGGSLKVPCLREKCLSERAIAERWNGMKCRRDAGLIPHRSTRGPLPRNLGAFCGQIAPMVSVLPVVPVRKYCAVYYLAHDSYHGMEEVIGSIPIRSTNLTPFLGANWRQFCVFPNRRTPALRAQVCGDPAHLCRCCARLAAAKHCRQLHRG